MENASVSSKTFINFSYDFRLAGINEIVKVIAATFVAKFFIASAPKLITTSQTVPL